jgi:ATP-dependent DNA ligase
MRGRVLRREGRGHITGLRHRRNEPKAFLYAFDLLELNGADLRKEPPFGAGEGKHGSMKLITRRGNDWTERYPLVVEAVNHLKVRSCLIDGEVRKCFHESSQSR